MISARIPALVMALLLCATALAGPLVVRTQPPVGGAEVSVDGVAAGTTAADGSLRVDGLTPGPRRVAVVFPGGRVVEVRHELPAGGLLTEVVVSGSAAAAPTPTARVVLTGNVGGALVELDGKEAGRTATDGKLKLEASAGRHAVRVSAHGFAPQEMQVELAPGPLSEVRFELRRELPGGDDRGNGGSGGGVLAWVLVGALVAAVGTLVVVVHHVVRQPAVARRVTTRRFERYEVREVVGRGGMATVFKATDTTRRGAPQVALKVMDEAHLGDQDLVYKFLREGEILMQLNAADPEAPLVEVYHFGRAGGESGRPFIAMELVEGEDLLRHLRRRGRLPLTEAARVVAGVARALEPAHALGVYHRDLSPDNIILTGRPRGGHFLRLIDFGVARHEYTSHGTLDGSIAGKPPYMSPEQCQGLAVDGRSDVYALGVILYALLVGEPPFVNRNPLEVMRMHAEAEVPWPADFPASARVIVAQALAKDRQRRHASVSNLLVDLEMLERLG